MRRLRSGMPEGVGYHRRMLKRLYVSNFRTFENFEFKPADKTVLLIGKNGSGKSTLGRVLKILRDVGRGINRVGELVKPDDFPFWQKPVAPMRFEIEAVLNGMNYAYALALELPKDFRELRVLEERLTVNGRELFSRQPGKVSLSQASFVVDWHFVALPVILDNTVADQLTAWREWLSHIVVLKPYPSLMTGESSKEALWPSVDGADYADWLTGLLVQHPAAYATILDQVRLSLPDVQTLKNLPSGRDRRTLSVRFENSSVDLPFDALSDGEKCTFLSATVIASNKHYGPLLTFWDEPDNYLSLSEVQHFFHALRKSFADDGGQLIATSHGEEAIRSFSRENTHLLSRASHVEFTRIQLLRELTDDVEDVVEAIKRDELEG